MHWMTVVAGVLAIFPAAVICVRAGEPAAPAAPAKPAPPPRPKVAVTAPAYCAEVKGDTEIKITAAHATKVTVKCWQQGEGFGTDATVGEVTLDEQGNGTIVFPADKYPHGPLTVRITGEGASARDNCYLQLYNKGGVSWNEGLTKDPPPAAKDMKLLFADDFDGALSIGPGEKDTYYDHKPPKGQQDFSGPCRFTSHSSSKTPFSQVDSYLRIRASEKTRSAGILSSMRNDGSGVKATAPCYFECRFIGPNAIGSWPAFWLLTDNISEEFKGKRGCDELDIIEAYGGEGKGHPNPGDGYMVTPHCWEQGKEGQALEKKAFTGMRNPIRMGKFGIPSSWFMALHTYGCLIGETDTVYYCDNKEVGRHATFPLSKERPFFFLINLATGGGWPVDLSRYDGVVEMYVDFVRVYQGEKAKPAEAAKADAAKPDAAKPDAAKPDAAKP